MNIKVLTNPILIAIGIVIVLAAIAIFQGQKESTRNLTQPSPTSLQQPQSLSNKTVDVALDVLQALSNYYVATQNEITDDSEIVDIMTALLNANKYLETGNVHVEKHINDPNEVVKLTAQGMTTGAKKVIQANDTLVNFLRSGQMADFEYAVATFTSNQKEGYKLISIAAPQITSLMFEPAKSENPSGKIPYTISESDRKRLLKDIERLFGDDLKNYRADLEAKTGKYNAILFSVDAIYNNLIPETYEEAKKIQQSQ